MSFFKGVIVAFKDAVLLSDYDNGGFDNYMGEKILFMDELKGQVKFSQLLSWLDVYKTQIHARYTNALSLWNEVYITSVYPPEQLYAKMVSEDVRGIDKQQQLFRRINDITYHFVGELGKYQQFTLPMEQYADYDRLKRIAHELAAPQQTTFTDMTNKIENPFIVRA